MPGDQICELLGRGRVSQRESQVRTGLPAGGKWIRTIGPPPEIVVDPSGSRRDHRTKYGCLSARPRVRCLCPPGNTQHLLPKSVFDRPGSDRWNLASTTFPDAGPMVRIRFPPAESRLRTGALRLVEHQDVRLDPALVDQPVRLGSSTDRQVWINRHRRLGGPCRTCAGTRG